jgi:hypothetical protein
VHIDIDNHFGYSLLFIFYPIINTLLNSYFRLIRISSYEVFRETLRESNKKNRRSPQGEMERSYYVKNDTHEDILTILDRGN